VGGCFAVGFGFMKKSGQDPDLIASTQDQEPAGAAPDASLDSLFTNASTWGLEQGRNSGSPDAEAARDSAASAARVVGSLVIRILGFRPGNKVSC